MPCPLRSRASLLLLLVAGLLSTGCTKFDVLNATIPSFGYARTADLPYGAIPRQKLDVYRPRSVPADAKPGAKVVVFFYGGYWQYGEKGDYRFVAEALASRGFVAVLPDYRVYPETRFPGFVEDGALAVKWVHDHIAQFGGDPQHIYLMGHSAGAHIATLLALDPHYLQAVGLSTGVIRGAVGLSGPYDFQPDDSDRAVFGMQPGDPRNPAIEPIHFARADAPPLLLVQGCQDNVVDPQNTIKLARAIRAVGGAVQTIFYHSRGHAGIALAFAWDFRWLAPVLTDTTAFVNQH